MHSRSPLKAATTQQVQHTNANTVCYRIKYEFHSISVSLLFFWIYPDKCYGHSLPSANGCYGSDSDSRTSTVASVSDLRLLCHLQSIIDLNA